MPLKREIAAVKVEVVGKTLRVVEGSGIAVIDPSKQVTLAPIPEGYTVTSSDGEAILPSRGFWVTLDTIDPFHLLADADAEFLRG